MPYHRLVVLALALASVTPAQSRHVVPGHAAYEDGDGLSAAPFGYTEIRCQQVWDADALTPTVALLFGVAMRPDAGTQNEPGRTYASFTVGVGYSAAAPGSLDKTFANNVSGSLTNVFQGPYSLPAQGSFTAPGPFNVSWAFSQPFFYDRSRGNLLLEIVGVNMPAKSRYFVDATTAGSAGTLGTSGPMSNGDRLVLDGPGAVPVPGGQVVFQARTGMSAYPSSLLVGLDAQSAAGVPLPFPLTGIGAPGNFLYVDVLFSVPWTLRLQGQGFAATQTFAVPGWPGVNGTALYGQAVVQHAASNQLGLVTSNGYEYRIGATAPITGQVLSHDPTSASGSLQPGGPVVEFDGVFP